MRMELNWKALFIIACWSIVCSLAIVFVFMTSHERVSLEMSKKIDDLTLRMNEKTTDRYRGVDAKRDFSRVYIDIKNLEKSNTGLKKDIERLRRELALHKQEVIGEIHMLRLQDMATETSIDKTANSCTKARKDINKLKKECNCWK